MYTGTGANAPTQDQPTFQPDYNPMPLAFVTQRKMNTPHAWSGTSTTLYWLVF
jgi:hypothetical protein